MVWVVFLLMTTRWPITVCGDTTNAAPVKSANVTPQTAFKLCRDRLGYFPRPIFLVHACAKCLEYLLPNVNGTFKPWTSPQYGFAMLKSSENSTLITPDPEHPDLMQVVCATLSKADCVDWTECCQASLQCCDRQISLQSPGVAETSQGASNTAPDGGKRSRCPMTWDGYSCVDATPAGNTVHFQCPGFLRRFSAVLNGQASKRCVDNGTWYTGAVGLEWTNYDSCYVDYDHRTILMLKLSFLGVSMALLIPSIAIFCAFRPLRSQLRIKLHINLFLSLALSVLCSLLWESLVSESIMADSSILHHQAVCKVLNVSARGSLMSTFFWMFCEGVYLTWLMLNSLRQVSSMTVFYFIGWGVPLLIAVVYTVVRITFKNDERCWLFSAGRLEWIIDGPTVACIGMNLLFLLAIMRVMLRQLRTHGKEQRVVMRSLRAMLILVPLFGLQQFFIIYRPQPSDPGFYVYEVASAAIMNLQGALLALVFCFFNGEVQGHLKVMLRRLRFKVSGGLQTRTSLASACAAGSTLTAWRQSRSSVDTSASVLAGGSTQTEPRARDSDLTSGKQTTVTPKENHKRVQQSGENLGAAETARELRGQDNLAYTADRIHGRDTGPEISFEILATGPRESQPHGQKSEENCLRSVDVNVNASSGRASWESGQAYESRELCEP